MQKTPGAVVVVGSLHYDIFVEAPHRPAPGETVTGHRWHPKFGGKGGNQAVAIAAEGREARMVSAVGDDDFGTFLLERLSEKGVLTDHVARLPGTRSGMSVAVSDASGDYGAVIVSGANLEIAEQALAADALWEGATHLVLQNEVREEINIAAARAARAHGIAVCLNAAPWRAMSAGFLDLVDILVVNALEAESLCGMAVSSLDSAAAAAEILAARFPCAVVTAGGDGVAFQCGQDRAALPAEKVELVSTHGAGDCFIGALVGQLAAGTNFALALDHANRAAARHVSQIIA